MKRKTFKRFIAIVLCMVIVIGLGRGYLLAESIQSEIAPDGLEIVANDSTNTDETVEVDLPEDEADAEEETNASDDVTAEDEANASDDTTAEDEANASDDTNVKDEASTSDKTDVKDEVNESDKADVKDEADASDDTDPSKVEAPILQLTYEDDKVKVIVDAVEEGNIPAGAQLSVIPIEKQKITSSMSAEEKKEAKALNEQYEQTEQKLLEKAKDERYDVIGFLAYDITFVNADGNKLEPNGDVKVSLEYKEAEIPAEVKAVVEEGQTLDVTVMHLEEDASGKVKEVVDMVADENETAEVHTTKNQEVEAAEFTTDSFSTFTIEWKVTQKDLNGNRVTRETYESLYSAMIAEVEGTANENNIPITDWKRSSNYKNAQIELKESSQDVSDSKVNTDWWTSISQLDTSITDQSLVWDGSRNSSHNFTTYLPNQTVTIYNKKLYDSATWVDHHTGDKEKNGTFYRFQGTFDIGADNPNNYTYTIQQVTGNDKIYINDDMWVFIYPEGTTLTSSNYMDYLAFWTGTRNQKGEVYFNNRQGTKASQDDPNNLKKLTDGWNMPVVADNAGAIIQSVYNAGNKTQKYVIDVITDDYASGGGMYRLVMKRKQTEKVPMELVKVTTSGTALAGATFSIEDSSHSVYYTATSGTDGKIRFNLLDGTYTLKETKAPTGYVRLTDTWTVTVRNGSYKITKDGVEIKKLNGRYVITNNSEREEALSKLESTKTVEVKNYDNREYTIKLGASTVGQTAGEEAKNASVILVLDASSSMEEGDKQLKDIKDAAKSFVSTLKTASPKSEVSVIWYSGSENNSADLAISTSAFYTLDTQSTNVTSIIDDRSANGGTPMGAALANAKNKLSSAKYDDKYVILFTDGMPGYWPNNTSLNCMVANNAYNNAQQIKNTAILYTVGYALGDSSFVWKQGHGVTDDKHQGGHDGQATKASDFLSGSIATDSAHAFTTDNKTLLEEHFKQLAGKIGSLYSIQPEKIVDVIDSRFELTEAQKKVFDDYNKAHESEAGNRITYVENADGTTTITWTGAAAHIGNKNATAADNQPWSATIDVVAKSDFVGGNMIPTNGTASGIYVDKDTTRLFPQPSVNVKLLAPSIENKEVTVYKRDTIESDNFLGELSATYKITELDNQTIHKLGNANIPALTDEDIATLKRGETVEKDYSYGGTNDVVGVFRFEYSNTKLLTNDSTITPENAVYNHEATKVGDDVEEYTLTVTFVPKTIEQRMDALPTVVSPDEKKGGTVVVEKAVSGIYKVNVLALWGIVKQSSSTDSSGNHPKLSGAKFKLTSTSDKVYYGLSGSDGFVTWYEDEACTKKILVGKLEKGTYTLREVVAPDGYVVSEDAWTIEIAESSVTIKDSDGKVIVADSRTYEGMNSYFYENDALYALPSTGGSGIYWYIIGGVMLMMAAALVLYKKRCEEVLSR